jgi:serine/threonine protein kinase
LKPGNILILDDGKAVLTDFGISKQLPKMHKMSDVERSPDYCAPEQYNINN